MDLLASYGDDGPPEEPSAPLAVSLLPRRVIVPPPEYAGPLPGTMQLALVSDAGTRPRTFGTSGRTLCGTIDSAALDPAAFSAQYNSYSAHGYAADPSGSGGLVGRRAGVGAAAAPGVKRRRERNDDVTDLDGYLGPWAAFTGEGASRETALERGELTLKQRGIRLDQELDPYGPGKLEGDALTAARERYAAEVAAAAEAAEVAAGGGDGAHESAARGSSAAAVAAPSSAGAGARKTAGGTSGGGAGAGAGGGDAAPPPPTLSAAAASAAASAAAIAVDASSPPPPLLAQCSSVMHGGGEVDYQGRSWTAPPKGVRADGGDHECFIPKRVVHRYVGHTKGVQCVEFFPGTGHLLLTASLDGRVKVWDTTGGSFHRSVRRTYMGHAGAVRAARFSRDGSVFASCSYDKSIKVWDTETGVAKAAIAIKGIPYCLTWAPADDPHVLMIGSGARKVLQWDLRVHGGGAGTAGGAGAGLSGSAAAVAEPDLMEYSNHLSAVNSITFFDNGRKFASTSDDKRLLFWEVGTPVPIKEIQDPALHAVSAACAHPGGGFLVGASQDNTLVTYAMGDRIGRALKKNFKGHVGAGYSCQPAFSPDGHFLGSGDGDGTLWFWDWRTCRILKSFHKAHEGGPAPGFAWHPLEPSTCASSGWDGVVKLWA